MADHVLQSIKRYRAELASMAAESRGESDRLSLEVSASMALLTVSILIVNELVPNNPRARALVDELVDRVPEILEEGRVNLEVSIVDSEELLKDAKDSLNGARMTNVLGAVNVLYNTRTQPDIAEIKRMSDGPFGLVGAYATYLGRTMVGPDNTPDMINIMDLVAKHTTNIANEFQGKSDAANRSSGSSSCFIATACFGHPNHQTVVIYRNFRERVLKKSRLGRQLIIFYYKLSPPMARFLYTNDWLKRPTTRLLLLLAKMIRQF